MDINFLKGKKIGITALDLEQLEHRGIAAVTKSLIQLLNKYGAEIYLITGLGSRRSGIFVKSFVNRKLLSEIYISDNNFRFTKLLTKIPDLLDPNPVIRYISAPYLFSS